jgi:hypothetical protein
LESFFEELAAIDQDSFLLSLSKRISGKDVFRVTGTNVLGMGKTDRTVSELPLIAEFLVRHGAAANLLKSLPAAPLRPALTRLLVHLEEMICLDYRLFTDDEYDHIQRSVLGIKHEMESLDMRVRFPDTRESNYRFHVHDEGPRLCDAVAAQCRQAKYLRLAAQTMLRDGGRLEGVESLTPNVEDENFEILAKQVRGAIENGTPELGLDRLHTFVVKYVRAFYARHFGVAAKSTATPNSLVGEIANDLRQKGLVQSTMTLEILKSSARVLEHSTMCGTIRRSLTTMQSSSTRKKPSSSIRVLQPQCAFSGSWKSPNHS